MKRLTRSKKDKKLCGVCGGIARYFDMDSTIVRLLFLLALGLNIILYIILAFVIPQSEEDEEVIVIEKRLTKSKKNKKLCGVCGGIAEYFGMDQTIVRVLFILFFVFGGIGLWTYIACAIVMPKAL